jgi:hypothetical protein
MTEYADTYLFAEAKHSKKDDIRDTQLRWVSAALECGLSEQNFLLVEWSFGADFAEAVQTAIPERRPGSQ